MTLETEGMSRHIIVDTGSNVSILQPRYRGDLRDNSIKSYGVTGEALEVKGRQLVSFTLG